MRVLVCDDNPMRHEMFVPLTWFGHVVVIASTVEASLEMLDKKGCGWDVVCLDHDFRGAIDDSDAPEEITGRALARRVVGMFIHPSLVVVHTANKRGGDVMMKLLLDANLNARREPLSNVFTR